MYASLTYHSAGTISHAVTCLVDGRCSAQAPAAVGEPCITDPQCAGDSRCTRSICGGLGGYCPDDQACASGRKYIYLRR
jgi:hypothetical protein